MAKSAGKSFGLSWSKGICMWGLPVTQSIFQKNQNFSAFCPIWGNLMSKFEKEIHFFVLPEVFEVIYDLFQNNLTSKKLRVLFKIK